MTLERRIELLVRLGDYIEKEPAWEAAKNEAYRVNPWFVPSFIDTASENIRKEFLNEEKIRSWVKKYDVPGKQPQAKAIGLVMAGNIPLVGFHDFLCCFISGHKVIVKPSSKDYVLLEHIIKKLLNWDNEIGEFVVLAERLKGCDAYIATGSNNSGRYFEYYFRDHPSIIRKNRTSAAVLTGEESTEDLEKFADDLLLFFGFGCRNVSKIFVPRGYDFVPLLQSMTNYKWMEDHSKFKNNYDYHLSLLILNHQYYMTNGTVLLMENDLLFSPISQVNFEYYDDLPTSDFYLSHKDQLQCLVGEGGLPFGSSQSPSLGDYADGIDTIKFLTDL